MSCGKGYVDFSFRILRLNSMLESMVKSVEIHEVKVGTQSVETTIEQETSGGGSSQSKKLCCRLL